MLSSANLGEQLWLKNVIAVGSVVSALGCLVIAIMKIHGILKKNSGAYSAWRTRRNAEIQQQREMPAKLQRMCDRMDQMDGKLNAVIKANKTPEGETLTDTVQFLRREEDLRFWMQRRPAFRCDDSGRVNKVSQAICYLGGTVSEQDLYRLGWKRMATNAEEMRDWFEDWQTNVAPPRSPFSGELHLSDLERVEPRGRGVVRMVPIGTYRGVHSWEGSLYPVDDRAKEFAEAQGWDAR
jgi:PAS domain-containing protein